MNFKKLLSLFTAVMLVVGSMAVVNAAAFPDIEARHSWAEEAIDSMVDRGILKGYTDGTFKPDRAVTHLETLIIASRIMGVDFEENAEYAEAASNNYSGVLSSYKIDYKDEIAYLLYCGVLNVDDLPNYISESAKNVSLKRYEAAILLTKLIGGEKEALAYEDAKLDFADASSISSKAKNYVKYVSDIGLMKGVEDNKFNPNGELNRAMISTVMYRAEEYMDASVVEGILTAKNGSVITLTVNGSSKIEELGADVAVKVDGKAVDVDSLSVGQYIRIHYQSGEVRYIDALTSRLYQTVSGTISSISETSGTKKITMKSTLGAQTYPIDPNSCEYIVNNNISSYADIKTNMYATLVIQGGYITKVTVETGSKKVTGTIKDIVINSEVVAIKVVDKNGNEADYVFNEDATITRNTSKADVRDLAAGDSVTLTISKGGIDSLVASSASKSLSGTISKIVISSNPEVVIKTATTETAYTVSADTKFVVDGKSDCTIYDLRLGADADVRVDSTKIISISTQSLVVSPTLTGVITYVHPTNYAMGLKVVDAATGETKEIQTVATSSVKVTDTTSSRISTFKALQPGMTVVVVGTSNYGVYEINQIIVTASAN